MTNRKSFAIVFFAVLFLSGSLLTAQAQTGSLEVRDPGFAHVSSTGSSARWEVRTPYSGATLTVAAPDGRTFSQELKAGAAPEFTTTDREGNRLPDGNYTYELRLAQVLPKQTREAVAAARGKDDDPESVRATRKRVPTDSASVQSGSFSILNGAIVVAGAAEETQSRPATKSSALPRISETTRAALTKLRQHHLAATLIPDDVIPDDLIVQGSACVGLDCVSGEVFGFDTIRLKENNTRLQYDDTSTSAGFPTNNWQIRANSSASGGASFLAFVDQGATGNSETGTIVFEVDAGAPANALKVSSNGKVGLRTATPVLDLHITTSDTPAHRLEQTSAGGFTAQTWDVAGNEANFFVRDVTGGSRLPFRIRPGAPTSSIDISASGSVGIGTASPSNKLTVFGSASDVDVKLQTTNTGTTTTDGFNFGIENSTQDVFLNQRENAAMRFFANGSERITLKADGTVGIATTAPTDTLSVNGTASKPGGGSWAVFSDERLKSIKGKFNSGLKAVMQLQPVRYEYKRDNALQLKSEQEHVGFGAQAVQKIIPEAVSRNPNGYLQVNNDPILWTMLNAIKEQQTEIEQLKAQIKLLRVSRRRR